mmetsp:Transcript_66926/g.60030  ORF Transcript_66926/g.60030 Transcript_66926/m.60030 type:complete len:542 (-) Transcript_66926:385-2010(-)
MAKQPKNNKSTKTKNSPRKDCVIKLADALKDDSKVNAKHIAYQSFGSDKNKTRKNSKACDRGTSSGPARYCSSHIRQIYPQDIIGDNNMTEWCVNGRTACCNNNSCRLCNIDTTNFIKLPMINFAEALREELGVSCDHNNQNKYNRALQSFLTSHIISSYPGTNKENTILRIKVNDQIWMEYFIKLTAFSSLLKTSAPSGYKYQDRISIGRKIKIQNNVNRDLIFCVEKDASYNDPEKEEHRPVVNCVGFWNLLKEAKQNEIRNIIHLNIDQGVNVSFGFLMKNNSNVDKIEVELECTRHGLGLKEKPITLWCWPSNVDDNNSMSSLDIMEHKSNNSGSPTISMQSPTSERSTSPITHHHSNAIPTISSIPGIQYNPISMATMPALPPQLPQLRQLPIQHHMHNNSQYQPQMPYTSINNTYQQPIMNDDNMSYYSHAVVNNNIYAPTHYGPCHATNYVDDRYHPYPIQQRPAPMSNSNNNISQIMEFAPKSEVQQPQLNEYINMDEYQAMEHDEFILDQDELSFPSVDNFPLLDNQSVFFN